VSYEPRKQDSLYRGTAEPTKDQKYRPILSHLILLRIAQVFDIYERAETNQEEIYEAASSEVDLDPKHPFLYQSPRNFQKDAYPFDVTAS
jgi:hypothetical protein